MPDIYIEFYGLQVVGITILMHLPGPVWRTAILAGLLIAGCGCFDSFAQGSMGGVIGKENKSVSGAVSSEPERPARRSKPVSETRRALARGGGGGNVSRFDGTWTFFARGCSLGAKRGVISQGSISGLSGGAGQVSASGAMRATFTVWGIHTVAVGHLSGVTGAGTYTRADGCKGLWTATNQQ